MKLSSLINADLVLVKSSETQTEILIERLVNQMCRTYGFEIRKDKVLEALKERDKLGKTILPGGIMIPHARFEALNDMIIGAAVPEKPILIEGQEIRILFLVLTGLSKSNLYLNTLAAFTKIARSTELVAELTRQGTAEDFLKTLDKGEILVKKDLTVADIMVSDAPVIHPESDLKEALDLLSGHNTGYLPVIDPNGRFLAEVSVFEILSKGIPNYASMMNSLSFLSQFEPFEELFIHERDIKARDVMKKAKITLPPESSIVEAAFEMVQHSRRHISVVDRSGKLLGVVSYMEIVNKVIRG